MGCCFSNPNEEPVIPQSAVSVYNSASSTNTQYPILVPGSGQAYVAQPYVQQYAAMQPYSQTYSQTYSQPVQQYQVPLGFQPNQLNISHIQYQQASNIAYSTPTYPYPTAPPQTPSRTYSQDPSNVI